MSAAQSASPSAAAPLPAPAAIHNSASAGVRAPLIADLLDDSRVPVYKFQGSGP